MLPNPEIPVEVEMKEMLSYRKSRTASDRQLSDSSFASVSSSSPSSSPRTSGGEVLKINPPRVDGEQQLEEGEGREGGGEEQRETEDTKMKTDHESLSVEKSAGSQTSLSSTASNDTTTETGSTPHETSNNTPIVTGSTHGNCIPPTSPTSLQDLSVSPSTCHLNAMSTDLLHDAIHDHSPQQRKSISLNGVAHRGSKTTSREVKGGGITIDIESSDGGCGDRIGLDADGMSSRYNEVDRRLTYVLQCYETRIAGLRQELLKTKAALAAQARKGTVKPRGREDSGKVEEEEEAATVGASIVEDNQVSLVESDVRMSVGV